MNAVSPKQYSQEQLAHLTPAELRELREKRGKRKKELRVPPLVPQKRDGASPLSFAQERLWFLDQVGLVGAGYNVPMALKLEGKLNVEALERSFAELIRRHETLRTRFEVVAGTPIQVIDPPTDFHLERLDLTALEEDDRGHGLRNLIDQAAYRRFDLANESLLRISLLRVAAEEHVLLLTLHHIISDGWSLSVLRRELSTLYNAYSQGRLSPLPELPVQYADYAMWQRQWLSGEELSNQLQYWRERLSGSPPQLDLPADRPRPAVASFKGAAVHFKLSMQLRQALEALARQEGATAFMVLLAAYQVLLCRYSGQHDIVVGSVIAGRTHAQSEGLIGFFVNTLVLRSDLSDKPGFRRLLGRVMEATLGAYAHQDLPFEKLVTELRPERTLSQQPLFQTALVWQNYPRDELELSGLKWTEMRAEHVTSLFDLTLHLFQVPEGLHGVFEYATDLFNADSIERMIANFSKLLESIVLNPECSIDRLPILRETELATVTREFNDTMAPVPEYDLVHSLFEKQVQATPDVIAVMHGGQQCTYVELNTRANELARYLVGLGVGPNRVVGICVQRGLSMIVGVLGILKAGGAYLPLDPNYPPERLKYMLEDARPGVLIAQRKLVDSLPTCDAQIVLLDETLMDPDITIDPASLPSSAKDMVYLIYTSGSTGKPKGTAMEHYSMVNLMEWHRRELPTTAGQRVLQFAALSFDVAFQEIFSTLTAGGTLVMLDEQARADPRALLQLLTNFRIERLFVPPLLLQSLAEFCNTGPTAPDSLRDVITAGEQLRISPEISAFFRRLGGCRLHNHYGPTETHVVTSLTLSGAPEQWPALPAIGRPVSNTQIYLVDEHMQPVPIGVAGEICIGGRGVARGYLGRPELTAQRFVADQFGKSRASKLYRTGDLGRWRSNGVIEYLGRNDGQVKIRGYRIELGEIEASLERHEHIREAAVIAREDTPGDKRLVAYITRGNGVDPDIEDVKTHLRAGLPDYMVPSMFVILDRLPVNPNGKLDRKALPAPSPDAQRSKEYEAPEGECEEMLARIWVEMLHQTQVGRRDNFFELGGHSLHVIKLTAKVKERLGVDLAVPVIFMNPTLRQQARVVEGMRAAPVVPESRPEGMDYDQGPSPLAWSQLLHWNSYGLGRQRTVRQIATALRLRGHLDIDVLRRSVEEIVRRHDVLRCRIVCRDGVPMQQVSGANDRWDLEVDDLTAVEECFREAEARRHIQELILEPIDVTVGPLWGIRLLRLDEREHILAVAMEHIISDGVSISLLCRDLLSAYSQLVKGRRVELPSIQRSFVDFAVSQNETMESWLREHDVHWKRLAAQYGRTRFPEDRLASTGGLWGWGSVQVRIDRDTVVELREWARQRGTTLVMSVFTAYVALVLRWCKVADTVIRYQSDGRGGVGVENTVGFFASSLYVRVAMEEGDTFTDLLRRVTEGYCTAYSHADWSYLATQPDRPEFTRNAGFNWLPNVVGGVSEVEASEDALACSVVPLGWPTMSRLQMDQEPGVLCAETGEGIVLDVYYPRDRIVMAAMERFGHGLLKFIDVLLRKAEQRVASIPVEHVPQ
jgi:amino acid adenylation domain-containing protein